MATFTLYDILLWGALIVQSLLNFLIAPRLLIESWFYNTVTTTLYLIVPERNPISSFPSLKYFFLFPNSVLFVSVI